MAATGPSGDFLTGDHVPRRVAYNTAVQLAGRALVVALGLISFALIARHLGVGGFGSYSLILTFVPLFGALADLGLTTIVVREISRAPEQRARIVGGAFTARAVLLALSVAVLLATIPFLPYDPPVKKGLALAVFGLALYLLGTVPSMVFQSTLRMELQVAVDVFGAAVGLSLVAFAVAADRGLDALVLAWVGGVGAGCVLAYALALRLVRFRPSLDAMLIRRLARDALPLGLVVILGVVHFKVDAILLSLMKPIEDVGVYNAAYRFLEQVLVLPALFIAAIFPVLTAYVAVRDPRLSGTVQKALTFLLMLGMPIAVASFILARPIIELIAGRSFEAAIVPLRILVWAVLFSFVNALFANLLVIYDLQRRILVVSALGVALNIVLNLILIPPYSYTGSAVATVITEALGAAVITVWAIRHGRIEIGLGPLPRIVAASLGMAVCVALTRTFPLAVPLALGALSYAALTYLLGVVTRSDLDTILREPRPSG